MFDGTRRGWVLVGTVILGLVIMLMGCAVVTTKGAPGFFEIRLGLGELHTKNKLLTSLLVRM